MLKNNELGLHCLFHFTKYLQILNRFLKKKFYLWLFQTKRLLRVPIPRVQSYSGKLDMLTSLELSNSGLVCVWARPEPHFLIGPVLRSNQAHPISWLVSSFPRRIARACHFTCQSSLPLLAWHLTSTSRPKPAGTAYHHPP